MAVKQADSRPIYQVSVHGLEHGRRHAHRRSARRRRKNTVVSGVMFLVVAGVVGGAGYYLWQFYEDEQARNAPDGPAVVDRSTEEVIDILEEQPRWNGPGNPAFGVGGDQP